MLQIFTSSIKPLKLMLHRQVYTTSKLRDSCDHLNSDVISRPF